jgi:hypothetical protein
MLVKRSDSQSQRARARAAGGARSPRNLNRLHEHSEDAARLLKALANGNRLLILCLLSEGPRSERAGDAAAQPVRTVPTLAAA